MRFLATFLVILACSFAEIRRPDVAMAVKGNVLLTDNYGNFYIVDGMNFSRYDHSGKLQKTFSDKNYGAITTADVSNPLRIVLYYHDFNRVVFLDNTLSKLGDDLHLETLGLPSISAVASGYDNGLWLFNSQNYELMYYNQNFKDRTGISNLNQLTGMKQPPDRMLQTGNHLYLHCPGNGIFVFDNFGTYSKTIPDVDRWSFQATDDNLIWFNGKNISFINTKTLEKGEYSEPDDSTALDMRIESKAIYVLKKDSVFVYNRSN